MYLRDVIARISDHPANRIDELLPDQWKLSHLPTAADLPPAAAAPDAPANASPPASAADAAQPA
jgi:hypothetical protein